MKMVIDCVLIIMGLGYFFGGLAFCLNFALDLGNKGISHFRDFVMEQPLNVLALFLFTPWLLISVFAYVGAYVISFLKGESMN